MSDKKRRVMVIGLDCAEPSLVFDRWRQDLPNLSRLMSTGAWGRLRSCDPPITVPAWSSMLSSRDPGQLGFYGFRNRANYSYDEMRIANATAVTAPRVWDVLAKAGMQSVLIGVPQTYPVPEINGWLVSDFLTPPNPRQWTHPLALAGEIASLLGGEAYEFDVKDFRTEDKQWLLDSIYAMTGRRWQVARYLAESKPWDFFMLVEMGVDRMHHGFWRYMDPNSPHYQPGHQLENAIHDYYVYIDGQVGQLLAVAGPETAVMVVSDHGAKPMLGGFCVNEWLRQQGYLALKSEPQGQVELARLEVDWARTRAWASGGYYARLFMNVAGREPQGTIPPERYEAERDRLKAEIEALPGPDGKPMGNLALKPEDIYREVNGVPPDLIVYFGGLSWRSVGSLGHGSIYTLENDTGPDDANHAEDGIAIFHDPECPGSGEALTGLQLECIAPTILDWLGVAIPDSMMAKPVSLSSLQPTAEQAATNPPSHQERDEYGYTPEEEAEISEHLASLGYL